MTVDAPSLVIAVLTFRRPADITAVLPLLVDELEDTAELVVRSRVVVVDNDPEAAAAPVVAAAVAAIDAAGIGTGFSAAGRVLYVHEPIPGISAARNRALDEAGDDDLLVFIDDDERPTAHWLRHLLRVRESTGATAVVGPVVSRFDVEPDAFIRAGRFFDRRRLPTGTDIEVAATNNLLLDLRTIRAMGLRFDEAAGTTGGEDTLFTRAIRAQGGRMVWCDEAVVHDIVPATRTTRRWVLLRALSSGNSWGLTSVRLAARPADRVRTVAALHGGALVRLAGGGARVALGLALGDEAHRARGLRSAARGAGMLLGAWGVPYREYRRKS